MLTRDLWVIKAHYAWIAKTAIDETLKLAKQYAEEMSPTDTWEFAASHKINPAQRKWDTIEWSLENNAKHARILETGVRGRIYKYHKWPPRDDSTVFFVWVGNRTYQRSIDKVRPILSAKFSNAKGI